jgi:hypothetical protein
MLKLIMSSTLVILTTIFLILSQCGNQHFQESLLRVTQMDYRIQLQTRRVQTLIP